MKAIEDQSQVKSDQTLTIPASAVDAVPIGQMVRVLIIVPENDTDPEWE